MKIHPTAIIDPTAELSSSVTVGAYTVIGPRVIIGADTEIMAQVSIDKDTTIGERTRIFPFASVGADPQDLKYKGEYSTLIVGDEVDIREGVTIHRGTSFGGGKTVIGNHCLIMATSHIAHDCILGADVIVGNYAGISGHIVVEDGATIGGLTAIHQFCRIGKHAFIGGFSRISMDVPPFMLCTGVEQIAIKGPNVLGLKRRGFSSESIEALKESFKIIFRNHKPLAEVLMEAEKVFPQEEVVRDLCNFFRISERGVYRN